MNVKYPYSQEYRRKASFQNLLSEFSQFIEYFHTILKRFETVDEKIFYEFLDPVFCEAITKWNRELHEIDRALYDAQKHSGAQTGEQNEQQIQ